MGKYYIGIDIGDGETAVAVLTEEAVAPQMLDLGYKDPSILSAVGLDENQHIVIGDNVMLMPKVQQQTVRFKSRFLTDANARTELLRFAQGLEQALQKHAELFAPDSGTLMTIGCPTGQGWTAQARAHYAGIIRQALPINEWPVGESRAAFLYARYGSDGHIPQNMLSGNVLVIDMGSSTTDLAYIVQGQDCTMNVFGSARLGGGLIDQQLLEQCVERHPLKDELHKLFERVPSLRHRCEVTARRIKEAFFAEQARQGAENFHQSQSEVLFYKNTRADFTRLVLTTSMDDMEALLHAPMTELDGLSFTDSLDALMEDAVSKTKEHPPQLIILTGGASRMPFVQASVQAHFPHAVISCCEHPEHSIACGLAFACRVDSRMEQFRQAIHDFTDQSTFEALLDQSLPELIDSLCDTLAPLFVEHLFHSPLFSNGKKKKQSMEESHWQDAFFQQPAVQDAMSRILKSWGEHGLAPLAKEMMDICLRYKVSTEQLPIPTPDQLHIEFPSFELNILVDILLHLPLIGWGLRTMLKPWYVVEARKEMKKLLQDHTGVFYTELRSDLKKALKEEIDKRARDVEIPIV